MADGTTTTIPGLTTQIARHVSSAQFENLPNESLIVARQAVLDWFGVTLAGYDEPLAKILRDTYATGGPCRIIGGDKSANVRDAALINGATSHALDYDDVNPMGHPTAPILPAVLAVAEAKNKSPSDALIAYIAGYEAATIIAKQAMPTHYANGFHSTGTLGAIGAAAAVSRLLHMNAERTAEAMSLAATQAAGLKCMFGTMTKPFHAGKAAANGVIAAELVAAGFESRSDGLETHQGFFSTQTETEAASIDGYTFGEHIRRNLFKYHAACYLTHSTIESVAALKTEHALQPSIVDRVIVHVPQTHLSVCNIEAPASGLETKFSLRHCVALKLSGADTASVETYSDESAKDQDLIDLRQRVQVIGDMEAGTHARVVILKADGRQLEKKTDVGIPEKSLSAQEDKLRSKFLSLTSEQMGGRAPQIADRFLSMDQADSIKRLFNDLVRS